MRQREQIAAMGAEQVLLALAFASSYSPLEDSAKTDDSIENVALPA